MTVYALLGGDVEQVPEQIACAAAIASRLKMSLTGLVAMPDPAQAAVFVAGPDMVMTGSAGIDAVAKAQTYRIKSLRSAFDKACTGLPSSLDTDFVHQVGSVALRAAGAAMLSGALVLPRRSVETVHPLNSAFDYVLMEAHLPLVLASRVTVPDETCLIAWDGSTQAARAVRLHADILRSYDKVVIFQNTEKLRDSSYSAGMADPNILRDYLVDRGCKVEIATSDEVVSKALEKTARDYNAGLLIMGAYGHSRLGELLFGGTSRALLHGDAGPALALAH